MTYGDERIEPVKRFNGFSSWANYQIHKYFHIDWHFHDTLVKCVERTDNYRDASRCLFFSLLGMLDDNGELLIQERKVIDVLEMEYIRYPEIVSMIWREVR